MQTYGVRSVRLRALADRQKMTVLSQNCWRL